MTQLWKWSCQRWGWFCQSTWRRGSFVSFLLLLIYLLFGWMSWLATQNLPLSLTIAAAMLATFVALFMDASKNWIWRPDISVSYVHGADYCEKVLMRGVGANGQVIEAPAYYFRLRIANKGTRRAEKLEVLAADLLKRQSDGDYALLRRYSMNLKWTHVGVPILEGISPKMERFCDIGHIIRPQDRNQLPNENIPSADPNSTILSFDMETIANHRPDLIEPGLYRLTLFIAASNNPPVRRILEIDLTGKWSDDMGEMLRDRNRVRLLSPAEITDSVKEA